MQQWGACGSGIKLFKPELLQRPEDGCWKWSRFYPAHTPNLVECDLRLSSISLTAYGPELLLYRNHGLVGASSENDVLGVEQKSDKSERKKLPLPSYEGCKDCVLSWCSLWGH